MKVLMQHAGNLGYAADQVDGMTLSELLDAVQCAIDEFGEDAEVVLLQTNNGRGANYGRLAHQVFAEADEDGDDDDE